MAYAKRKRGVKAALSYIFVTLLFIFVIGGIINIALRAYYPLQYEEQIRTCAAQNGLDPSLVAAVIHTESRFRADSISGMGAYGLMQITPDTLYWIAEKNGESVSETAEEVLLDPAQNIKYGCMILSQHIEEFGSEETALAAYNAGRSRIISWLQNSDISNDGVDLHNIPYPETAQYVEKVMYAQKVYQNLYHIGGSS